MGDFFLKNKANVTDFTYYYIQLNTQLL